jgi:hypothetical protein
MSNIKKLDNSCLDIPLPIVKLNRWTLLLGVLSGFVLQQPLVTTFLFLMLLVAVLFGQKYSLVFQIGKRVFARQNAKAETEDRRLMRFNNSIATILFGLAQIAFLLNIAWLGWVLSFMVAVAAAVALAGFCFGCFLYFQFKLNRYRLLGGR